MELARPPFAQQCAQAEADGPAPKPKPAPPKVEPMPESLAAEFGDFDDGPAKIVEPVVVEAKVVADTTGAAVHHRTVGHRQTAETPALHDTLEAFTLGSANDVDPLTFLEKLDSGEYDCLILAAAGLSRLGFGDRIHQIIPSEISLHAVGQGALGIECVEGSPEVLELIKVLEHGPTAARCLAERSFLRELEGGCQVPIGVNTVIDGDTLTLTGMVASLDGKRLIRDQQSGTLAEAEEIGKKLADILKGQGAGEILKEIFEEVRPQ